MTIKSNKNALTDDIFWDQFWDSVTLPDLVDEQIQWQSALANTFRQQLPYDPTLKLVEIGCAPGRWLIWFNKVFGYHVTGCDISTQGVELTQKNFAMNDVDGAVYQADAFSDDLPKHEFDIVASLGLIEHFDEPHKIIDRHLRLLKPGGIIILEVPNMAGSLNLKLMQSAGMHDFLAKHNLGIMTQSYFNSIARDFDLQIQFLNYIGGFDLGLIWYNFLPELRTCRIRNKIWVHTQWSPFCPQT